MQTLALRRTAAALAAAATLALAAGCGNITTPPGSSTSSSTAPAASGAAASSSAAPASSSSPAAPANSGSQNAQYYKAKGSPVTVAAGQPVKIAMGDLFFNPNTLVVASGTKVTIDLTNPTPLQHNFSLDAFKISQNVAPNGGKATVSFTPTAAGTYYFYCNVPGHAQSGMVGQITVK